MENTMRQVLKASQVQFDTPLQLSLDRGAAPTATAQRPPSAPTPIPARARVVESHPEYALVEVTCSCGQTTYIRCDYEPTKT
jgi:hypothetical protein